MTFQTKTLAPKREIWAWAMFDFANSGYTTVVLTAIFNVFFVSRIYQNETGTADGSGTLYWTWAMAIANFIVLLTAPWIGAIADVLANKKKLLAMTTVCCVLFTALLATVGPGETSLAMIYVIIATVMFGAGENIIAAFLPELSPPEKMGRISGYGWSLGYVGGLLVLALCLAYVFYAMDRGQSDADYVPVTMLITAGMFLLASLPTFIILKERSRPKPIEHSAAGQISAIVRQGSGRLMETVRHLPHFRDLFFLLSSIAVFTCGVHTVITLAAVFAAQVFSFTMQETITMIMVVNVTAAVGALAFGIIQDKIGSRRTLIIALLVWIVAVAIAYFTRERSGFWLAANLVGLAMGASQSAGRALVGQFTPLEKTGEFFGLWGLSIKLAAIVGPLSYGLIAWMTGGEHRTAILSTLGFFIAGLLLLLLVNEERGHQAVEEYPG